MDQPAFDNDPAGHLQLLDWAEQTCAKATWHPEAKTCIEKKLSGPSPNAAAPAATNAEGR